MAKVAKSNLIPIGYVGKKDVQTDPVAGTGLEWRPGDVHNVTPEQAAILLNHPDVWVDDRPPAAQAKKPIEPHEAPKPVMTEEEERAMANLAPLIDVGVLDKSGLQQYAMREFGLDLNEQMPESQMRAEITSRIDGQRYN